LSLGIEHDLFVVFKTPMEKARFVYKFIKKLIVNG